MKLSREVSHELVKELILVLGAQRAQQILSLNDARLKFLANGHGCLSYKQLEAIECHTGRAWLRWVIDAGGGGVKTAEGRAFVASAHAMWDKLIGPEKKTRARPAKRINSSAYRTAV